MLLNKAGRLVLVNSVLSSLVIYHMTIFPLIKMGYKKDRQNPEKLPVTGSRRCKERPLPGELDKGTKAQGARWAWGD
jgi:hypothetical protein